MQQNNNFINVQGKEKEWKHHKKQKIQTAKFQDSLLNQPGHLRIIYH